MMGVDCCWRDGGDNSREQLLARKGEEAAREKERKERLETGRL